MHRINLEDKSYCTECNSITLPAILARNEGNLCDNCSVREDDSYSFKSFSQIEETPSVEVENTTNCPVHGSRLKKGKASIYYGLPSFSRSYFYLQKEWFPYSNQQLCGGCIIQRERTTDTLYCKRCRISNNIIRMIICPFFLIYILYIIITEAIFDR